jgi:hypothetical protein
MISARRSSAVWFAENRWLNSPAYQAPEIIAKGTGSMLLESTRGPLRTTWAFTFGEMREASEIHHLCVNYRDPSGLASYRHYAVSS